MRVYGTAGPAAARTGLTSHGNNHDNHDNPDNRRNHDVDEDGAPVSPLMWMCVLLMAALLGLLGRVVSRDSAAFHAHERAWQAWQRTGRAQPGWGSRFAWAHDRWPDIAYDEAGPPVVVTAQVVEPEPVRWWHQDSSRHQQERPAPVTVPGPPSTAAVPVPVAIPGATPVTAQGSDAAAQGSDQEFPRPGDRAVVEGGPGQVIAVDRIPGATRLTIRRDDGVIGHVDIPDADHIVPVSPASLATVVRRQAAAPPARGAAASTQAIPVTRSAVPPPAQPAQSATSSAQPATPAPAMTIGGFTVPVTDQLPGGPQ